MSDRGKSDLGTYASFIMKRCVSLEEEGPQVPIIILRDTAASQSIILKGVFPLSHTPSVSSDILVQGFGM